MFSAFQTVYMSSHCVLKGRESFTVGNPMQRLLRSLLLYRGIESDLVVDTVVTEKSDDDADNLSSDESARGSAP